MGLSLIGRCMSCLGGDACAVALMPARGIGMMYVAPVPPKSRKQRPIKQILHHLRPVQFINVTLNPNTWVPLR